MINGETWILITENNEEVTHIKLSAIKAILKKCATH